MCLKMKQTEVEASVRFQIEPTRFQSELDIGATGLPKQFSTDRLQPGINSLVLAMRFRDCLSEQEQNLLDLLAPDRTISFLIKGERFLHPAGVPLFPLEMIESMGLTGGNAILSLRYRPQVASDIDCYRLRAARISTPDQAPLILGMLGPEPTVNSGSDEDYFAHLASVFRQAWQTTSDLASLIAPKLGANYPTMVINRSAGRPLAANRPFSKLVGLSQDQLINKEYSELAVGLSEPVKKNRLTMENISTDGLDLCVTSLQPAQTRPVESSDDGQLTGFLVHAMRNKLAAIIAASSHMRSLFKEQESGDTHELTDIILEEAAKMDRHLNLLDLIANYSRYNSRPTSISEELNRTTTMITGRYSGNLNINIAADSAGATINVPAESLSLLFDAILSAHLVGTRSDDCTSITLTNYKNKVCLRIVSTHGDAASRTVLDKNWQHVAVRLATLLNFRLGHDDFTQAGTVETNLEIPTGAIQYAIS